MTENLYLDKPFDFDPGQSGWEDAHAQMKKLDKQLRKLRKKKKSGKNGKSKKLKKQLKALEREHQQLRQLLLYAIYQGQLSSAPQHRVWWQDAITNSLPKAIELATVSMNKLPGKK